MRDPAAAQRGNLRCSRRAGAAQTRLRLKQRAALIRPALRFSARPEGVVGARTAEHPLGPLLRSAKHPRAKRQTPNAKRQTPNGTRHTAHGTRHTAHGAQRLCHPGQAQQWPVWMFGGASTPCGCACAGVLAGWRVCRRTHPQRGLTRRGCPSAAPQARSEFYGAPRKCPGAGVPQRCALGSQAWGRFSFGYVSLARQRKVPRPPGRDPAPAFSQVPALSKNQAQSQRMNRTLFSTKSEAFSAPSPRQISANSYLFRSACTTAPASHRPQRTQAQGPGAMLAPRRAPWLLAPSRTFPHVSPLE